MNYAIELTWNDTLVLKGEATLVCAYEIARAHIADNFAGRYVQESLEGFTLTFLQDWFKTHSHCGLCFKDTTGHASARIIAL